MKRVVARCMVLMLLCSSLLLVKAEAQTVAPGVTKTGVILVMVGIAGTGALIGIGVYYAVSHSHSIRGCAVPGPNGLELKNEGDQKVFQLQGLITDVKPGDRVKVNGKKKKLAKSASGNPTFLVEKLAKDYGACKTAAAKP